MKLSKKKDKLAAIVLALGLIIFVGGGLVRSLAVFEIFEPGPSLSLKESYDDAQRLAAVKLFSNASFYADSALYASLVAAALLAFSLRGNFKKRGWLFMFFSLYFLGAAIAAYLSYYDFSLMRGFASGEIRSFASPLVEKNFLWKLRNLTPYEYVSYLCELGAVVFLIWRPLDKGESKQGGEIEDKGDIRGADRSGQAGGR